MKISFINLSRFINLLNIIFNFIVDINCLKSFKNIFICLRKIKISFPLFVFYVYFKQVLTFVYHIFYHFSLHRFYLSILIVNQLKEQSLKEYEKKRSQQY